MAGEQESIASEQLLLTVAEQLKLPLLQIARQAEQAQLTGETSHQATIRSTAESALRLLDYYALGIRLHHQAGQLDMEPVSIAAVLYDAGQQLTGLARAYGVDLDLHIAGKFGPVIAHRQGLQAALVSLGAAFIEALPAHESTGQLKLQLATHRCRYGIVAGLYTDDAQLTAAQLRQGRRLLAQSRQPLVGFSPSSGAGIFVADSILQAMQLRLRSSRHHGLFGLGAVLTPTNQLQLV
ncbi:MAG TPA: hypothetical protein VG992_01250 [Candidatus Saccharimonadales bacterium]|nr:hypothetical protein [Candidatus Saccharimonadales bacterium]